MVRKTTLLILLMITGANLCNAQRYWIVGGQEATEGQLPWLGDLRDPSSSHFCGSALIYPRWVLTAGHCMDGIPAAAITVRFNTVNTTGPLNPNGGVQRKVLQSFVHQSFDINMGSSAGYDIALLLLDTAINNITPIALPTVNDTLTAYQAGAPVKISGWGIKDTISNTPSDMLKWCNSKIIDFAFCDNQYYNTFSTHVDRNKFCAGYTGSDPQSGAAAGDSGGPIWTEAGSSKKILGVVSGGFGQTTLYNQPGLFTKVAAYRPWIDSVINAIKLLTVDDYTWNDNQIKIGTAPDRINIYFGDIQADKVSVMLYSLDGKVVHNAEVTAPALKQYSIATGDVSTGMYLLRVADNRNGRHFSKKLINTN